MTPSRFKDLQPPRLPVRFSPHAELRELRNCVIDPPNPYVMFDLPRMGDAQRFIKLLG